MWLFVIFTQGLAATTSAIAWWFVRPSTSSSKIALVASVFAINNLVLIYGLSAFWQERFQVYLVVSILQGFMIYAVLITATAALLYYQIFKRRLSLKLIRILGLACYFSITGLAVFNAYSPVVHRLTVTTSKPLDRPLTIAMLSDMHLGRWFGNRQIASLVTLIDAQNPDTIVLAGDIMNDTTIAYEQTNMHERLSKLAAPLGVYAVLGNHDYRGYENETVKALQDAGITVLDNESTLLDGSVWLVGRSDDVDRNRLSAPELLAQVNTEQPIVFLEHRPSALHEVSALPIDLHLSGHTHGGQIFPLTLIMQAFEPLVYGAKQIANTQFVVSSGYGFGPVPFRLGTRSEMWIITLQSSVNSE